MREPRVAPIQAYPSAPILAEGLPYLSVIHNRPITLRRVEIVEAFGDDSIADGRSGFWRAGLGPVVGCLLYTSRCV